MLDPSTPIKPGTPIPGTDIEFVSYKIDWGAATDLASLTEKRLSLLGGSITREAWYLNPKYSVHAPRPSADFFRVARYARDQWLYQSRQILSNHGQRREARSAEQQGRRVALLDSAADRNDFSIHRLPEVVRLNEIPKDLSRRVRDLGHLAKQFAFSGVMLISGALIAPKVWNRMADEFLNPGQKPRLTITNRHVDLEAFKLTNDLEPVKQLTRQGLKRHLSRSPLLPAYIAPYRTIMVPEVSSEFFVQAKRCHDTWAFLLNRTLTSRVVRRLHREADAPSFILAFSGVLVVDGQLYLKGCWPNQSPKPAHLRKTPFNAPTVPPEFLGLTEFGTRESDPAR